MSGLQGSGKTTFSGKLANYLKKKGRKPLLVAGDVPPAAIDQLHVLGEQPRWTYSDKENKDPVAIAQAGIAHARSPTVTPPSSSTPPDARPSTSR